MIDITHMTIGEISELPRDDLNDLIRTTADSDTSYANRFKILLAAQYRIIDLEYELQRTKEMLDFYKKALVNAGT